MMLTSLCFTPKIDSIVTGATIFVPFDMARRRGLHKRDVSRNRAVGKIRKIAAAPFSSKRAMQMETADGTLPGNWDVFLR